MTNQEIWDCEQPVGSLVDIEVPEWVQSDTTASQVAAIVQGGCASGAYMPAVTYYDARKTMAEHGDEVLDYISEAYGELPSPAQDASWDGRACFFLSVAVELWAQSVMNELEEAA